MQLSELYRPWAVDNARWGIEILQGKYKESVIQIESVEFAENDPSSLQLDYHTINIPDGLLKEDYDSSEFVDTMQLIISHILSEAIQDYKENNGD